MLTALLALSSSVVWGIGDFLGGLLSRRHAVLAVMAISQGTALVVIVAVVVGGAPIEHDARATAWAAGAGVLGVLALGCFYRALSIGTMSLVAPISATGVSIPVLVGLAGGERPSALQLAGVALATAGVVLAGREAPDDGTHAKPASRGVIGLALVAAIGFGSYLAGVDRAKESADIAWVLLASRIPNVALLAIACLVRPPRWPHARRGAPLVALGFFDLTANGLYVVAADRGLLSVVGVLGSLYPAVTVLLARIVLHERLAAVQNAGVLITLAGVVALAAG